MDSLDMYTIRTRGKNEGLDIKMGSVNKTLSFYVLSDIALVDTYLSVFQITSQMLLMVLINVRKC
jgi:hypothetical protein